MVKPTAKPQPGQKSLFAFFSKKKTKAPAATPTHAPATPSAAGKGGKHTPVDKAIGDSAAPAATAAAKTSLFPSSATKAKPSTPGKSSSLASSQSPLEPNVAAPVASQKKATSTSSTTAATAAAVANTSSSRRKRGSPLNSSGGGDAKASVGASTFDGPPAAMVGLKLKIFWPQDDAWYPGTVAAFNAKDALHHFEYDDGEEDWLDLAEEDFQIIGGTAATMASGSAKKQKKQKCTRRIDDDSSEEEEYIPGEDLAGPGGASSEDDDDDEPLVVSEEEEEEEDYVPTKRARGKAKATPKRPTAKKASSSPSSSSSPYLGRSAPRSAVGAGGKAKASAISGSSSAGSAVTDAAAAAGESAPGVLKMGQHNHNKYPWLNERRRDKQGRRPGDDGFDERTLLVPREFMKKETPAQQQWWQIKSDNMDAILFFKVGKFYEIFNQDADAAIRTLNGTPNAMVYMKGEKAHCGFPEKAYGKFAELLVAAGHRVLRVEQMETPDMLKARNSAARGAKDKCVRREVVSLLSKGTRTMGVLEQNHSKEEADRKSAARRRPGAEARGLDSGPRADLLMSLRVTPAPEKGQLLVGFCVVDASIGMFQMGQFQDAESLLADFRVLLVRFQPREIAFDANLPEALMAHVRDLQGVVLTKVPADAWSADGVVRTLAKDDYLGSDQAAWPAGLQRALARGGDEGPNGPVVCAAFEAVGGAMHYLARCLIDVQLVSQRKIYWYDIELGTEFSAAGGDGDTAAAAPDDDGDEEGAVPTEPDTYMQLDSEAIQHLELVRSNDGGQEAGTVLGFLDHCVTAFGKRQLRQWVLFPLFSRKAIIARQVAVRNLMALQDVVDSARQKLRSVPDLERLLSRNHANGSEYLATRHPVGRAIMYENPTYNATKIKNFVQLLRGFRTVAQVARTFEKASLLTSPLLKVLTSTRHGFPALASTLDHFDTAFDHAKALADGFIVPKPGFDDLYDDCVGALQEAQGHLHDYLTEIRAKLNCRDVQMVDKAKKNAYQLEIPESRVGRKGKGKKAANNLPADVRWEFKGSRKGWERYTTAKLTTLIGRLDKAKEAKQKAVLEITRRMFERFDRHAELWLSAVKAFTALDCLMSLMLVSKLNEPMCCPTLLPTGSAASIKLQSSRHPCVAETFSGDDFVPNDVAIGADGAPASLLLTGPNMGGKSTLLRQVATCVILAQIGCYVPAEAATLSLVDRVFTRLGANDDIMAQKSTFFIELSETAKVLKSATPRSLVILDELGRGTSTFDGAAIATSVLSYLTTEVKCATVFSTHYHNLVEQFAHDDDRAVGLGHMDFVTEEPEEKGGDDEEGEEDVEQVVFLYKLVPGACPKSFGMNVARLADLPLDVIRLAAQKSRAFEAQLKQRPGSSSGNDDDDVVAVATRLLGVPEGDGGEDELVQLWESLQIA